MARGFDYGVGMCNIDRETGIRYGVIPQYTVSKAWSFCSEAYYGEASCPQCGGAVEELTTGDKGQYCTACNEWFDTDECWPDEPLAYILDDGEYVAQQVAGDGDEDDIAVIKSPYYTRAAFCSPCAPGACYLLSPCEEGEKAYCFGPDWFDEGRVPYPIYRVDNDERVNL